jgi:hypothetical protein
MSALTLSFIFNSDFLSSSPIRNVANVPARTRPLTGITRTQSGSHIPHLSKQPTPAPSSPGITDHDGDFTFDADGDMLGHADGTDDVFVGTSGGNGGGMRDSSLLSVLETTSGRAMRELRLEEELGRYKTLVEEMKAQAEERDALSRDKVCTSFSARITATDLIHTLSSFLSNKHSPLALTSSNRSKNLPLRFAMNILNASRSSPSAIHALRRFKQKFKICNTKIR